MSVYAFRVMRIARELAKTDALLAYELEQNVRTMLAANPGFVSFETLVQNALDRLAEVKSVLDETLKKHSEFTEDDLNDFASTFDDEAAAEVESLRLLMEQAKAAKLASSRQAGPKDWFKGLFKKKNKQKKEEESDDRQPSYRMDDSDMDDFIEGKKDWDSSRSISEQAKEKDEFFDGVKNVMKIYEKVIEAPSKAGIQSLSKLIDDITSLGKKLIGKSSPKEESVEKKKPTPKVVEKKPSQAETPNLEGVVQHYVDMLQESSGDIEKTKKYLKELFQAVKKDVAEEHASLASSVIRRKAAVRLASYVKVRPAMKPALLPLIVSLNRGLSALSAVHFMGNADIHDILKHSFKVGWFNIPIHYGALREPILNESGQ